MITTSILFTAIKLFGSGFLAGVGKKAADYLWAAIKRRR
jgi:hypothetical protein